MNTMNTPGFTAEASAYRSSQTYFFTGSFATSHNRSFLSPALRIGGSGLGFWCEAGCVLAASVCYDAALLSLDPLAGAACAAAEIACLDRCSAFSVGSGGIFIG